jgi:hypothetical protein
MTPGRPRTPGRSSAACCSAGASLSTRRPRSSSSPPSRPRSKPVRLPGHRAGADVFPPPVASRCSDNGLCPGTREQDARKPLLHIGPQGVASRAWTAELAVQDQVHQTGGLVVGQPARTTEPTWSIGSPSRTSHEEPAAALPVWAQHSRHQALKTRPSVYRRRPYGDRPPECLSARSPAVATSRRRRRLAPTHLYMGLPLWAAVGTPARSHRAGMGRAHRAYRQEQSTAS